MPSDILSDDELRAISIHLDVDRLLKHAAALQAENERLTCELEYIRDNAPEDEPWSVAMATKALTTPPADAPEGYVPLRYRHAHRCIGQLVPGAPCDCGYDDDAPETPEGQPTTTEETK